MKRFSHCLILFSLCLPSVLSADDDFEDNYSAGYHEEKAYREKSRKRDKRRKQGFAKVRDCCLESDVQEEDVQEDEDIREDEEVQEAHRDTVRRHILRDGHGHSLRQYGVKADAQQTAKAPKRRKQNRRSAPQSELEIPSAFVINMEPPGLLRAVKEEVHNNIERIWPGFFEQESLRIFAPSVFWR